MYGLENDAMEQVCGHSALEVFLKRYALYKFTFYLLTYLLPLPRHSFICTRATLLRINYKQHDIRAGVSIDNGDFRKIWGFSPWIRLPILGLKRAKTRGYLFMQLVSNIK